MKLKVVCILISVSLIFLFQFGIFAEGSRQKNEFYFNRNEENMIALTFDDGPHPRYTYEILNILKKYGIKATFFIIGINASNYPETLKAVANEGHEIGNHTFTHQCIKGRSNDQVESDVNRCNDEIYNICGITPLIFRPPGGIMSESEGVFTDYKIIYWSIDTLDWAHRSADDIYEYVINNVKSGDIILMHDYIGYNSPTPSALELIIPNLLERGFKFVTVSELLA